MKGSGGSAWPTAKTRDHHAESRGENPLNFSPSLAVKAEIWPTPMAGTPAQNGNNAAGNNDFTRKAEVMAQGLWPTPCAVEPEQGPNHMRSLPRSQRGGGNAPNLATTIANWQTPVSDDCMDREKGKINSRGEPKLSGQAMQWPTPRAQMANGTGGNQQGAPDLQTAVSTWPTPAARDHKGENSPDHLTNGTGRLHMDQLPNAVAFLYSHPAPAMPPHGVTLSQLRRIWRPLRASVIASHGRATWRRLWKGRAKRRLNPNFVSWLMGWPSGHALCACSATEFTRWQRQMRGALSVMPMASGQWIWKPSVDGKPQIQEEMDI